MKIKIKVTLSKVIEFQLDNRIRNLIEINEGIELEDEDPSIEQMYDAITSDIEDYPSGVIDDLSENGRLSYEKVE